jgi:VanZ family protein
MSPARLLRNPRIWLIGLLLWLALLCVSSSLSPSAPADYLPSFKHIDKFQHFAYFFGGGLLLTGYFFRRKPEHPDWRGILRRVVLIVALIGWLDEWHQTFTPGRSGNDPYDWLANLLGATAGAMAFRRMHHRLK